MIQDISSLMDKFRLHSLLTVIAMFALVATLVGCSSLQEGPPPKGLKASGADMSPEQRADKKGD